ncbi:hypothetical protein Lser_V15G01530 [Lactuca serriola]
MKILSSNDSEDWLLIRMKEMMKHKMMNRFHKRNSSSASYVDFKSGEKLDFKFSTLQALQNGLKKEFNIDHTRERFGIEFNNKYILRRITFLR